MPDKNLLAPFECHGVLFEKESGTQMVGRCPFCGKDEKFYAHATKGLWDCKVCGISGNVSRFLQMAAAVNHDWLMSSAGKAKRKVLMNDRRLPWRAFSPWGTGYDIAAKWFTLPVCDSKGTVVDVRRWKLGTKRTMSTTGCHSGLIGHQHVPKSQWVAVCEGEWDAIALRWLLKELEVKGWAVVAVPGANVFKRDWVSSFVDKRVVCFFDNDVAGEQGELNVGRRLGGITKELQFVEWPEKCPKGFDVRDWIVWARRNGVEPQECWNGLRKLLSSMPRQQQSITTSADAPSVGTDADALSGKAVESIGWRDCVLSFRKWLHLKNDEPLAVLFGGVLANIRLEGDPIWMFMVAPPGGMKSELLMSLSLSDYCYSTSSLTPHSLVSGATLQGGVDPSLIPRLDGKVLVVKDFTTTLSMNPVGRDEIFGQLRDAYDGKYEKQFGNGAIRRYESLFGLIAGVTPNIDAFASLHSGLGERFLKYRLEKGVEPEDEEVRIARAMSNINTEVKMRDELRSAATNFIIGKAGKRKGGRVRVARGVEQKVIKLAMVVARLRGVVHRDRFRPEHVMAGGSYEIGTRLAKQLLKLGMGISLATEKKEVGEKEYALMREVALGSSPQKNVDVVRAMWRKGWLKTQEVSDFCPTVSLSTVFRTVQDLRMLGLLEKAAGRSGQWRLKEKVERLVEESELFNGGVSHIARKSVRVMRRRTTG